VLKLLKQTTLNQFGMMSIRVIHQQQKTKCPDNQQLSRPESQSQHHGWGCGDPASPPKTNTQHGPLVSTSQGIGVNALFKKVREPNYDFGILITLPNNGVVLAVCKYLRLEPIQ